MKYVKFTDGTQIPIFDIGTGTGFSWEYLDIDIGTINRIPNAVTVAYWRNNRLQDREITKTDIDGNIWQWRINNNYDPPRYGLSITTPTGERHSSYYSYSSENGGNTVVVLCYRTKEQNNVIYYELNLVAIQGLHRTLTNVGSIEGAYYNDESFGSGTSYSFSQDGLDILHPKKQLSNYVLNNTGFFDIETILTQEMYGAYPNSNYAQDVLAPSSNTVGASSVFGQLNLSKNTVDDDEPTVDPDPYTPGGDSEPGGGGGDFDDTSDSIDFPALPTISAVDTGLITLYNPSTAQLVTLAHYLWDPSGLDLDGLKKLFADPMEALLGLAIIPCNVPAGSAKNIMVGNIDTGVSVTTAASQWVEIDCGSINLNEYWGSYLDYNPYTKCSVYLPFIGIRTLDIDDVMAKTIHVKYHIDILSGACVAYVKAGSNVLYSYNGQCAASVPISGRDFTQVISAALSVVTGFAGSFTGSGVSRLSSAAGAVSSAFDVVKPNIERSGSTAGAGGLMGIKIPYLILTRPRQCLPAEQNSYIGYPSFITDFIYNLTGYTEIEEIHLENIPATGDEITEIENILKGGVLL